jgi:hypothetical protein
MEHHHAQRIGMLAADVVGDGGFKLVRSRSVSANAVPNRP